MVRSPGSSLEFYCSPALKWIWFLFEQCQQINVLVCIDVAIAFSIFGLYWAMIFGILFTFSISALQNLFCWYNTDLTLFLATSPTADSHIRTCMQRKLNWLRHQLGRLYQLPDVYKSRRQNFLGNFSFYWSNMSYLTTHKVRNLWE